MTTSRPTYYCRRHPTHSAQSVEAGTSAGWRTVRLGLSRRLRGVSGCGWRHDGRREGAQAAAGVGDFRSGGVDARRDSTRLRARGGAAGRAEAREHSGAVWHFDRRHAAARTRVHGERRPQQISQVKRYTLVTSIVRFDFDSISLRIRLTVRSTAYQRSLSALWRNTGCWPASRSHADLFIYLGHGAPAR